MFIVSTLPVMLLTVYIFSTSLRPRDCLESCYVSVQVMYLLDMLFQEYEETCLFI